MEAQNGAPDGVALIATARERCSTRSRTRVRSRRRRSARPRSTSSRGRCCRPPSQTRTPSPARSSGSRTAATRTTPRPTGGSRRPRRRERQTSPLPESAHRGRASRRGPGSSAAPSACPSGACSPGLPWRPSASASSPPTGGACRAAARDGRAPAGASCSSPTFRVEVAGREGRPNRATGLGRVRAVVEAAAEHELLDIRERLAEALRESQSCSSRSPGVSTTSPPPGSSTSCRCVVVCRPSPSSSRIGRRREQLLAGERVHERRLADARRAEQRDRAARSEVRADDVEPVSREVRDGVHRHAERDRLDLDDAQRVRRGRGRSSSGRSRAARRSPTPSRCSARAGAGCSPR